MHTPTRILTAAAAAVTLAGVAAAAQASAHTINAATAQATASTPQHLTIVLHRTALRFFSNTGPIPGYPTKPLVPGDRVIGQDRVIQGSVPAGHDNEVCTVAFTRDVLCQDIVVLTGQGDVQASWSFRWPATGTRGPASFNGIIDGGTAAFAAAHGTFHARALPNGDLRITATIGGAR
jgi:hypothetical protein